MCTGSVGERRRILLDVQPQLLEDALADVLRSTGLDEVLVSRGNAADSPTMAYDAVILTLPDDTVHADVVIEITDDAVARGHVTIGSRSEDVALPNPKELLALLDRLVPAAAARARRFEA